VRVRPSKDAIKVDRDSRASRAHVGE